MARYAHVIGWGMAVPEQVMTNRDLEQIIDTTDEWIINRTGIRERRIANEDQTTATLATEAAKNALADTALDAADLQLIIVASASPEHIFPSTASIVQDALGASNAGAFDLSAACTGFIFALNMAAQAIRSGSLDNALVIGAETLSKLTDWEDRNTCILFGDGAGAFILQASEEPGGILSCIMRSDGSGADLLSLPAGGSKYPATEETLRKRMHKIKMNGREVFRFAIRVMVTATREATAQAGLQLDEINLIIPHQANLRIIQAAARGLRLPIERFMVNLERYGNTSSASIPIAACEAIQEDRIQPGDHIVLVGFGGGLTWGALVLQWVAREKGFSRPLRLRRKLMAAYYRLRSLIRRLIRKLEGLIWSATSNRRR